MTRLTGLWEQRLDVDTPYGKPLKSVDLPNANPGSPPVKLHYLCPLACWSLLVVLVPSLWPVLEAMARKFQHTFKLLLYNDGATAGNVLNFDPAKAMELVYISSEEFEGRLSSIDAWCCICCIRTRRAKDIQGGLSRVASFLFEEAKKMGDQLMIQGPPGHEPLYVRVQMGCFISDEAAQHAVFSFKGRPAPPANS